MLTLPLLHILLKIIKSITPFLIPTFIVIITCINKIFMLLDESLLHSTKSIVLSSLVCLLPTLYFAMFRGYIDVAILLPISLIILLTIDITLTQYQKGSFSKDIVLGILLVIVVLFRRYSAFFVVGYVGSLGVIAFIELIKINNKLENFKNVLKHFCTIGFTSLGILILFFNKFIINAIGTNYAAQYVAYDAPLTVKTEDLISRFGLIIFLLIFAAGIITPLVYKKLANLVYFLLISIFLSVVFFFKVQLMGEHHVYVITIQLLLLSVIGLAEFLLIFKKNRCIIPLVLILLYICNFIYCYVPKNSISDSKLFCTKYIPFVRNDISEIEKLVSYLNTFSKEGKAVYVAASGTTLNCDIVRSVYKPYTLNAVPTLLASSDIDLRDGFPISFLDADIIVTTDPIELHAAEGTQEVVRFLSQEVMNHDSIIGKCFEYSNSFMLDNNVTAQVYIRIKDFTAEEVTYIMSYYDQYYPDYKELFKNRLEEYLTTISH